MLYSLELVSFRTNLNSLCLLSSLDTSALKCKKVNIVISFSRCSTFILLYELYLRRTIPLAVLCKTQADGSLKVQFRCSRAFKIVSQVN